MRRLWLALSIVLMFGSSSAALARITGITGTMDAQMQRGQQMQFDVDIVTDSGGFSGELNVYINADDVGLGLLNVQAPAVTITPQKFNCTGGQQNGFDFETCLGGVVQIAPNSKIHISQVITVHPGLVPTTGLHSAGTLAWTIQLVGTGLSGLPARTGTITVIDKRPDIRIAKEPAAMVDARQFGGSLGSGSATTAFSLVNVGDADGIVNFTQSGNFFSVSCSGSATIPAGKSATCSVSAKAVAPGRYVGQVQITGDTNPATINVVIQLDVDDRPTGTPKPRPTTNRVDAKRVPGVSGSSLVIPLDSNPTVTIGIVNEGDGPVRGLFSSDVDWIILPDSAVVVAPGETKNFDFSVDLSARPFPADPGSLVATLSLTYLLPASSKSGRIVSLDSPGTGNVSVTLVSTVAPPATSATPPSLAAKCQTCFTDSALFIPGVGHAVGSVGQFISDLVLFPKVGFGGPGTAENRALSSVDLYFTPLGSPTSGAKKITVNALAPPSSAAFGDMVSTVFGANQVGTLQIRTLNFTIDEVVGINANVFNVSNKAGTYGTALPVFLSDAAVNGSDKEYLTGLRKDATSHTNLYLQESIGSDITAGIDFYDAGGNKVGSTTASLPAFGAVQLGGNTVPNGTVSAAVSVASGSGAVHAYATPVDEASGDTWIVVDWARIYSYYQSFYVNGANVLIPVAGAAHGANNTYFKTDAAIMNVGSGPASGTLRYYIRGGQPVDKPISLSPLQTQVLNDITTNFFGVTTDSVGYITYTPTAGRVAITSRNYTTTPGSAATFGTAVPTIPLATNSGGVSTTGSGIPKNGVERIAGVEDAALSTVGAAQPGSFRSNFGLVEVGGQPATVQVTIYFNTSSDKTSVIQGGSATYTLAPNEFKLVGNIANAILGPSRPNFGDLHNMTVEFKVVDGGGRVVPFISSIDNGSGDSTFRVQ